MVESRGLSNKFWEQLKICTNQKLMKSNLNFEFKNPPKDDGTYLKAKGPSKSTNWVYAVKSSEVWIELELTAREKENQQGLYKKIKLNKKNIEDKIGKNIRWNNKDIIISKRQKKGKSIRIKLISNYDINTMPLSSDKVIEKWSDDMIIFMKSIVDCQIFKE
jgi:hypothetical protein